MYLLFSSGLGCFVGPHSVGRILCSWLYTAFMVPRKTTVAQSVLDVVTSLCSTTAPVGPHSPEPAGFSGPTCPLLKDGHSFNPAFFCRVGGAKLTLVSVALVAKGSFTVGTSTTRGQGNYSVIITFFF